MKVGIVDYGHTGNLFNVKKALLHLKVNVLVIDSPEQLSEIDALVLPGVGAFASVMHQLQSTGLGAAIRQLQKPVLGICIGMQILAKAGFENQFTAGLDVFDCDVKKLKSKSVLPHLGFKHLSVVRGSVLLKDIEESSFYFMHSYGMDYTGEVQAYCSYGGSKFPAVVQKDNFYGVQFHPEKSRLAGIQLFKNFLSVI